MNLIINLADHLPRMTAEDLLTEAKLHMTEDMPEFEEFLFSLPKHLRDCLEFGMNDIDYRRMQQSELAVTMRILAMLVVAFDSYLGTSIGRASCKVFADNPLEWCVAILKSMREKTSSETSEVHHRKSPSNYKVVRLTRFCK